MTAQPAHAWVATDPAAARSLSDARRQVHVAIQFGAAFGISYLPPARDDGHTNLGWDSTLRALVSRSVATPAGAIAVGVRVEDLALVVTRDGHLATALPLDGRTIDDATAWLRAALGTLGLDPSALTLRRHYAIPEHAVMRGAPFDATDHQAFGQLSLWFANAAGALTELAAETPGASDVRLWPHHFDIATLVVVAAGRSTGAGLVGGDGYYDEPYFYVNIYPQPTGPLPDESALGGGSWHVHEWIGAVLPASRVTGDGAAQEALVRRYLRASLATCRSLAGG